MSFPWNFRAAIDARVELCFHQLCGIDYPLPVVRRGWLHLRSFPGAWDVDRLFAALGRGAWLSAYSPDDHAAAGDPASVPSCLRAFAGFWPGGGFIEVTPMHNAELENHPRYQLRVFARTSVAAAALMVRLQMDYLFRESAGNQEPRIGLVNCSYSSLEVQRVPVSPAQLVPRAEADIYYGDGMSAWIDAWEQQLLKRRYGLTILTGAPGTGKTTLLRSVAAWLHQTHAFYFMPASKFGQVDAGDLVSFWIGENRLSKLRNVLVLEDAESILLRREGDNRERVAALLNLTDGVMGDALALQIVCTLNSDLTDLDPALLRPGRLIAQRVFAPLPLEAARRLARHLGRPVPEGVEAVSLAELFNPPDVAMGRVAPVRRGRVGFAV